MSNFQVELGKDDAGNRTFQRVPVIYGDASRQASQILRGNSENTIKAVPAMAVHINALSYDTSRIQEPTFVSKLNIRERYYDQSTGEYTDQQGDSYTVERLMPVPYKLTLKVDLWTSNTEQKLQLIEQIAVLFNPAFEIQSTDNYIDWTSLSYVLLTDISWSNRVVPVGTEETIDIAGLTFELPIWISAPAKVKKLGVIQKIINSIYDPNGQLSGDISSDTGDNLGVKVLTFENYDILYQGNTIKLLKRSDLTPTSTGLNIEAQLKGKTNWAAVIDQYGVMRNGLSTIRLMQPNGSEIVGTIALHPTDTSLVLYTPFPDTMPANTMPPVDAIINPQNVDVDSTLLNPTTGTRYLLTHAVGYTNDIEVSPAWNRNGQQPLVANANDIVEYNGSKWVVVFDSKNHAGQEYLTNLTTSSQYHWQNGSWHRGVEGRYDAAQWSLVL
jgi:hypothetical protein